jgi:acyl carrier protein
LTAQETVTAFITRRFRSSIRGGRIAPDDPLISTGVIDSFGVLEMIAFLEDTFGVTIDPTRHELTEFETVDRIVDLVEHAPRRA